MPVSITSIISATERPLPGPSSQKALSPDSPRPRTLFCTSVCQVKGGRLEDQPKLRASSNSSAKWALRRWAPAGAAASAPELLRPAQLQLVQSLLAGPQHAYARVHARTAGQQQRRQGSRGSAGSSPVHQQLLGHAAADDAPARGARAQRGPAEQWDQGARARSPRLARRRRHASAWHQPRPPTCRRRRRPSRRPRSRRAAPPRPPWRHSTAAMGGGRGRLSGAACAGAPAARAHGRPHSLPRALPQRPPLRAARAPAPRTCWRACRRCPRPA
jgi:hypothetical protein